MVTTLRTSAKNSVRVFIDYTTYVLFTAKNGYANAPQYYVYVHIASLVIDQFNVIPLWPDLLETDSVISYINVMSIPQWLSVSVTIKPSAIVSDIEAAAKSSYTAFYIHVQSWRLSTIHDSLYCILRIAV